MNPKNSFDKFLARIAVANAHVQSTKEISVERLDALEGVRTVIEEYVQDQLDAGQAVVFQGATSVYSVVSLSSKGKYPYQVTRCSSLGFFGDSQYASVSAMVSENGFAHEAIVPPGVASLAMLEVVAAEAKYQEAVHA